jgi:Tol biopolymer transport system component
MGEVYRARDTRLGRDVALKVLPEAFAADRERMARLRREAQVLASLNHPSIAAIYGFEDSSNVHALVMELVEGPTLAERIKQGAIPLDEALPIAKQIAEGLEYAHERGIIHRDLKPSNVKVTPDGAVKVLDFGLAKAIEGDASATSVENSPTLSAMATRAGFLLGTAAYMSPEQARGKNADRRSDIWGFGVVLFEMLSGTRLFVGETTSDTLAAVIRADPEWNELPANTPPKIRELLQRCLRKDPRQRLQSIGDARIAIDETLSGALDTGTFAAPTDTHAKNRERIAWAGVALFAITAMLFAVGYFLRAPKAMPAYVSELPPPANAIYALVGFNAGPPVLSPDGLRIAFCAIGPDGRQLLWVRSLDGGAAQPLEGTDGASFPFWSPDSRSIGFFAQAKLKRIDASGGPALVVASATIGRGGSWGPDGTILYVPDQVGGIYGVGASGGTPREVTELNESLKQINHRWPQFLPDGKHFLFMALSANGELSGTYAGSLAGGEPKLILRGGSNAIYAPPGDLLFVQQGALMAQRFDAGRLELEGDAVPLGENAAVDPTANVARGVFDVSENGVLVFAGGGDIGGFGSLLSWFDRTGKPLRQTGSPGQYATIVLSPDGTKLAVGELQPNGLWVFDLSRGTGRRVTFGGAATGGANAGQPAWSPDGKTLAFFSTRAGLNHIYQKAADGSGVTTPLVVDDASETYPAWSPDGRYLIFNRQAAQANSNIEIWAMPLFGDRKAFPVVRGALNATWPAVSPDGKWLGYTSSESGRDEVYVVPFLHGSGKWLVSTQGGNRPRWRHDGKELFYLSPDNRIMAAEILTQSTSFTVGEVEPLFQASPAGNPGWLYDVSADGKEFVVVSRASKAAASPVTLVVNWPALLKKQ